ncbi:bifunctional alpha,alpha-trehalose-phosphate synthase (UDP-forming)/trehalose-phosphatase [Taibaiella koreensis]|uniref:bifunctional alpha,alpha-trehalose-phosphate synthase (UDP-forming)/trehalose-phosphatase n=1 Tax=Taibaiella koreensis TaxID=1268548 RepID=UPI000E59A2B7|nr:bifunctional alpha,alpha-trehalose-phosphate synthase (UDP-forming)/trehalose-phosphatase [Taibaiella koreensis]
MMKESRTIIVSNRLPVKITLQEGEILSQGSEGGLATGLSSIYGKDNTIWIGWPGVSTGAEEFRRIEAHLEKQRLAPVPLSTKEVRDFYEGFSNETLWPLFHYFPDYACFKADQWEVYKMVNLRFAEKIVSLAAPGDKIWIHDYHLLLVPDMVRERLPGASIGFFQHIPFPNFEMFRFLPWRNELMKGLLGADIIGFHTQMDVDHFIEVTQQLTDTGFLDASVLSNEILVEDRTITVEAFPMGIDYEKYRSLSCMPIVKKVRDRILDFCGSRKLMVSVDRLDYSKGILHRLKAYDRFLEQHPEFHEKVIFIQLIVPSRDQVSQYHKLKEEVNQLVSDINTRYGGFDWEPIRYWYRSLDPEMLSGLYAAADVALVTPLRDGMNLVSKEYIASKTESPGVLVLSELAGAAQELTQALIINPHNEQELADAIFEGLIMPVREQLRRLGAMQRSLSRHTVQRWAAGFLDALDRNKTEQHAFNEYFFSREMEEHMLQQFISRDDVASIMDHLQPEANTPPPPIVRGIPIRSPKRVS